MLQDTVQDTAAQTIPENLLVASPVGDESRSREPSRVGRSRKPHGSHADSPSEPGTAVHLEPVVATLDAYPPSPSSHGTPRQSGEWTRGSLHLDRKSLDVKRQSLDFGKISLDGGNPRRSWSQRGRRNDSHSRTRDLESQSRSPVGRSASHKEPRKSSLLKPSKSTAGLSVQVSGSQMLDRSDLFSSPTIRHSHDSRSASRSQDASPDPGAADRRQGREKLRIQPPVRAHSDQSLPRPQQQGSASEAVESPAAYQQWVKAGNYPLQRAAGFADYLKTRSKKLSSQVATGSLNYVEKVSGVWAGGRKHYSEEEAVIPDPVIEKGEAEDNQDGSGDRFRAYFALTASEKLCATFFGWLHRGVPIHGKIYVSRKNFCFRSLFPGSKTRLVLPIKDVENVYKEKGFRFSYSGLVIIVRGHEEIFFDFKSDDVRNDCVVTLLRLVEYSKDLQASELFMREEQEAAESAKAEHQLLQAARKHDRSDTRDSEAADFQSQTVLFDDPRASILNFKPSESLRITCLTIGSRGDIQPYIALCKGLLKEGHKVRIATHVEFQDWVEGHGIDFKPIDGDPAELMRTFPYPSYDYKALCVS